MEENIKLLEKQIYDLAFMAFLNLSHDPEKRASEVVSETAYQIESDLPKIMPDKRSDYIAKYHHNLKRWLEAKSKCASSMVTGPGNFNLSKNNKAHEVEHKRLSELLNWRKKYLKKFMIIKQIS